jgi:hypothetical protein
MDEWDRISRGESELRVEKVGRAASFLHFSKDEVINSCEYGDPLRNPSLT